MSSLAEPTVVTPVVLDDPASLVLRCVICTNPVPKKRATSRSKDTCSPECHAILRKYKKHVLRASRCPACYHPSSPEERKDFIQWRKHRGDRESKAGRPSPRLRKGLISAIELLKSIVPSAGLEPKIQELEKLIDSNAIKQSTLPASGHSA